jgi:hypothetical protein
MFNIIAAMMSLTNSGNKPAPSEKSQRTTKQVELLRVSAQLKRDVRAKKLNRDHGGCIAFNPCYKVGKPSQKFFKYREIRTHSFKHNLLMIPIHD